MKDTTVAVDGLSQIRSLAVENQKDRYRENRCLYQLLCDEAVLIAAYENIKSKAGNMTSGIDNRTLDGYSLNVVRKTIEALESETFRFSPVRVQKIPKKNGKFRQLGITPPPEKVIQEAMRMILEAIFEPTFSNNSHGYRPAKGCHSALKQVQDKWMNVKWIIEGDIKGFFDNVDHHALIRILRKRIKDERFINLIWKALRAGKLVVETDSNGKPRRKGRFYIGTHYQTRIGIPQGSIVSPMLSNIYLNEFDQEVGQWIKKVRELETVNGQTKEYTRLSGKITRISRKVDKQVSAKAMEKGSQEHKAAVATIKALRRQRSKVKTSNDVYRAIKYVRYADDWLIGIYGPKEMAESVKARIELYLGWELKLELSPEKTLITRPDKDKVKFLGAYIKKAPKGRTIRRKRCTDKRPYTRNAGRGSLRLEAPIQELMDKLVEDNFAHKGTYVPKARRDMISRQEWEIVAYYNTVLRGILNYYSFAANKPKLGWIVNTLQKSLVNTLARRRRCSPRQVWKKGKGKIVACKPTREGMKLITFHGYSDGLSLASNRNAFSVNDEKFDPEKLYRKNTNLRCKSKLGSHCAVCGSEDDVQMHHVRHVHKMGQKPEGFTAIMAQINRKQVPVCHECHRKIHDGKYNGMKLSELADKELAMW